MRLSSQRTSRSTSHVKLYAHINHAHPPVVQHGGLCAHARSPAHAHHAHVPLALVDCCRRRRCGAGSALILLVVAARRAVRFADVVCVRVHVADVAWLSRDAQRSGVTTHVTRHTSHHVECNHARFSQTLAALSRPDQLLARDAICHNIDTRHTTPHIDVMRARTTTPPTRQPAAVKREQQ
jgi:hypothetical protein